MNYLVIYGCICCNLCPRLEIELFLDRLLNLDETGNLTLG